MSYVVLARKLRPLRFEELIGQQTTARILKNAILTDRVTHAFLFTGSRGLGKTSAARILTKAINCLNPDGANPCNICEHCVEIHENASPDVYEIDAASNRGIENIRELRENIKYAPARCRYKVYIIDEAHMLTPESFNALLKTLEEPPAHVKFILATTDPHKLPETIISRCQRYDFIRVPVQQIADYLAEVSKQEGITLSRNALELIARHAAGGMRDALTALDQIVSYSGSSINDQEVAQILGIVEPYVRMEFVKLLLNKDAVGSLNQFSVLQEHGHDFHDIWLDLLNTIKSIALIQSLGSKNPLLFQDLSTEELKVCAELGKQVSQDEIQQIFHILLELKEQMKQSGHAGICFEMALLQITSVHPLIGISELIQQVKLLPRASSESSPKVAKIDSAIPKPNALASFAQKKNRN